MKKINKSSLSAQKGFTLIELVVVIVILGILAATAAPKFINLAGDATGATIKAVKASVESATIMVHAKALVGGQTGGTGTIDVNGTATGGTVGLVDGWPNHTTDTWAELLDVDTTSTNPPFAVAVDGTSATDGRTAWYPGGTTKTVAQAITSACYVLYEEGTDSNIKPDISVVVTGC